MSRSTTSPRPRIRDFELAFWLHRRDLGRYRHADDGTAILAMLGRRWRSMTDERCCRWSVLVYHGLEGSPTPERGHPTRPNQMGRRRLHGANNSNRTQFRRFELVQNALGRAHPPSTKTWANTRDRGGGVAPAGAGGVGVWTTRGTRRGGAHWGRGDAVLLPGGSGRKKARYPGPWAMSPGPYLLSPFAAPRTFSSLLLPPPPPPSCIHPPPAAAPTSAQHHHHAPRPSKPSTTNTVDDAARARARARPPHSAPAPWMHPAACRLPLLTPSRVPRGSHHQP